MNARCETSGKMCCRSPAFQPSAPGVSEEQAEVSRASAEALSPSLSTERLCIDVAARDGHPALLLHLHFYRAFSGFAIRRKHAAEFPYIQTSLAVDGFCVAESFESFMAVNGTRAAGAHAAKG